MGPKQGHRFDIWEAKDGDSWASVSEQNVLRLTTSWLTIAMVVAKKYVLIKAFDGFPSNENIELQEETLAPLKDGGRRVSPFHHGSYMHGIVTSYGDIELSQHWLR